MANVFKYTIGRKFIQAISGAFLIVFLLLHMSINLFSVIDSLKGQFDKTDGLFMKGCEFMTLPIIKVMVPVLALGFIIHIIYGVYLTFYNIKARGGYKRYEVSSRAKADSWAAKNMFVLGIIILGILAIHLSHFWAKMQLPEFLGKEAQNPYELLKLTFGTWWSVVLYIVWFTAIWFHLNHGFWSMFQTVGFNNQVWMKRLKVIGILVSSLIWLGFTTVAVNSFIMAHCLCK